MFYFVNLFNKHIISRHKSIRTANMAAIAFDEEFYKHNSKNSYMPTAILYKKGKPLDINERWVNDPEIELGLTDPPGCEDEKIWRN